MAQPAAVPPVKNEDELKKLLEAWMAAKDRALRMLICGLGGVGKSTLINRLLQLEGDEKWAEEGTEGGPMTTVVAKHEKTTKRGVKVCLFDTPGFGDVDISSEEIIAMMEDKTEKKLDVVFYCFSLEGSARVQDGDARAIKIMTQAFTHEIWRKAVIVFTFANSLESKKGDPSSYWSVIGRISDKVKAVLRKEMVPEDIITKLPIVTAGHIEPILKYEAEECKSLGGWDNRLFLEAAEQVDPNAFPALFEVRFSFKDLLTITSGGGGGAAIGGLLAKVAFSASGGPLGFAIAAGATAGLGTVLTGSEKVQSILKIKYEKWRLKSKLPTPRQATEK